MHSFAAIHAANVVTTSHFMRSSHRTTHKSDSESEDAVAIHNPDEERQRQEEMLQLELKRAEERRIEKARDEASEKIRLDIFKTHLDLVKWASESKITVDEFRAKLEKLETLQTPRYYYQWSDTQGLPSIGEQNLFRTILACERLNSKTQYEFIVKLFHRGYLDYFDQLFKGTDPEAVLRFITHWMKMTNEVNQVIAICKLTAKAVSDEPRFSVYTSSFYRIARLRILEIVENEHERLTQAQVEFLAANEPLLFSRHKTSRDIYQMLDSHRPLAKQKFIEKCDKSDDEINAQLRNHLLVPKARFTFLAPVFKRPANTDPAFVYARVPITHEEPETSCFSCC